MGDVIEMSKLLTLTAVLSFAERCCPHHACHDCFFCYAQELCVHLRTITACLSWLLLLLFAGGPSPLETITARFTRDYMALESTATSAVLFIASQAATVTAASKAAMSTQVNDWMVAAVALLLGFMAAFLCEFSIC